MYTFSNILRRGDVERITGLSRSTIYEYMARDAFPRPVRLSGKSVGWVEGEVRGWITARIAERDTEVA